MAALGPDSPYEVAYDEAVRALVEQQAFVDSLRSGAGLLLSGSAITTSFLGARALGPGELELMSWLATASFVGVALVSLIILWPRRWEFEADPVEVIEAYIDTEQAAPAGKLYRDLSFRMRSSYLENRRGLNELAGYFQLAICLLTAEVILWVAAIALPL
ncbi:MAG TPA: hypothetical protein VF081_12700 [Solirubrobacterales bacterium]